MAVALQISPLELEADPGAETYASVSVHNAGTIVERFSFDLLGLPEGGSFEPSALSIYPGEEAVTTMKVTVPKGAFPGATPIAVKAMAETSGEVVVEEATLHIGGRSAIDAKLRPQTSRTRRKAKHVVDLANWGNEPASVILDVTEPGDSLSFQMIGQEQLEVSEEKSVRLKVRIERKPERGERFPFVVTYDTGDGPRTLDGAVVGKRGPRWPLICGLGGLLAVLIAFMLLKGDPATTQTKKIEQTTTTAGAAAAVTEPPTTAAAAAGAGGAAAGGAAAGGAAAAATTKAPQAPVTQTSLSPQGPVGAGGPGGITAPTTQEQSLDRLLAAFSQKNWNDAKNYATDQVVAKMQAYAKGAAPGQKRGARTIVGSEAEFAITSSSGGPPCDVTQRGISKARYPAATNQLKATSVDFCDGSTSIVPG